ncbi:MAG: hypothetical protein J3K34DRAFT_410981 [Monoraphidium minutum]|nr:MAG: hypothetical protein J3K34DRAFT_410981 [Monoraphidium minutum]
MLARSPVPFFTMHVITLMFSLDAARGAWAPAGAAASSNSPRAKASALAATAARSGVEARRAAAGPCGAMPAPSRGRWE